MRYLVCVENDITTYVRNTKGDAIFISNETDAKKVLKYYFREADCPIEYLGFDENNLIISYRMDFFACVDGELHGEEPQWTYESLYLFPLKYIRDEQD